MSRVKWDDSAYYPFLATIADRPKESGPLAVFADFLEERGECDLAEFYRLNAEALELGGCEYGNDLGSTCLFYHQNIRNTVASINRLRQQLGRPANREPSPKTEITCRWCSLQGIIKAKQAGLACYGAEVDGNPLAAT